MAIPKILEHQRNLKNIKDGTGQLSIKEGYNTTASGQYSHAEGEGTKASGARSHAEGYYSTASNTNAHAEGYYSTASSSHSHAEGYYSRASGSYSSHAEGYYSKASGSYGSHAEGDTTTAKGKSSHSEGVDTTASGNYSHAEGNTTVAKGESSHSEGTGTHATTRSINVTGEYNRYESAGIIEETSSSSMYLSVNNYVYTFTQYETYEGRYEIERSSQTSVKNLSSTGYFYPGASVSVPCIYKCTSKVPKYVREEDENGGTTQILDGYTVYYTKYELIDKSAERGTYAHIVGNGDSSTRSNAHTLDWDGNAWFAGDVYVGSTSGTDKDDGSKRLATEEYVDNNGGIFWAEYGVTTYEEVVNAFNSGKAVFSLYPENTTHNLSHTKILSLYTIPTDSTTSLYFMPTTIPFTNEIAPTIDLTILNSDNTWRFTTMASYYFKQSIFRLNGTTPLHNNYRYYRPILVSNQEPTASDGDIGDIWIVYDNE